VLWLVTGPVGSAQANLGELGSVEVWYTARRVFDSSDGEKWISYIRWSGLTHLKRLLSLDTSLCPAVPDELSREDWNHNVQSDFLSFYFHDLAYLANRTISQSRFNILAAVLEPNVDVTNSPDQDHFTFKGFDLVERETGISALVNCGGFDLAFDPSELSEDGLIVSQSRARNVQASLRERYREEHHAHCDLWAVWLIDTRF
jgi:hypothetical protein